MALLVILAFSGSFGALMLAFGTPAYQSVTRMKMFGDENILGKDREFGHPDILVTYREFGHIWTSGH